MDSPAVGSLERIAPIFTVRDVLASLAYYRQLGFVAREYAGGGYRFVTRDGIEIHTSARYLTAIRGLSALRRRSGLAMPMTSLGPGARRERRYDRRRTPTGDSTRASSSIPTATSSGSAHRRESRSSPGGTVLCRIRNSSARSPLSRPAGRERGALLRVAHHGDGDTRVRHRRRPSGAIDNVQDPALTDLRDSALLIFFTSSPGLATKNFSIGMDLPAAGHCPNWCHWSSCASPGRTGCSGRARPRTGPVPRASPGWSAPSCTVRSHSAPLESTPRVRQRCRRTPGSRHRWFNSQPHCSAPSTAAASR